MELLLWCHNLMCHPVVTQPPFLLLWDVICWRSLSITFCFVYFAFCYYNNSSASSRGSRKGGRGNRRKKSQNKSRQCILMNESETCSKVRGKHEMQDAASGQYWWCFSQFSISFYFENFWKQKTTTRFTMHHAMQLGKTSHRSCILRWLPYRLA